VRGFIDDTHRWLGVDDSRHSLVYAGVFAQGIAYDLATQAMGTTHVLAYAKAGASLALGKHAVLGAEYTHPLTSRVRDQYICGYDYYGVSLAVLF
jgi:hypothetical protein